MGNDAQHMTFNIIIFKKAKAVEKKFEISSTL